VALCGGISNSTQAQAVANNIPLDGYLRGAEAPALSTDPTLFFRGAGETLCQIAADLTVDKTNSLYSSAKKDQAITQMKRCLELDPKREYYRKQLKRLQAGDPKAEVPPETE